MEYSLHQIELATCLYQLVWVFVVVAVVAYLTHSRLIFWLGMMGAFAGFVIPQPLVYADYSSVEGAFMAVINDAAEHVRYLGIIGATCGCLVGGVLVLLIDRHKANLAAHGNNTVTSERSGGSART